MLPPQREQLHFVYCWTPTALHTAEYLENIPYTFVELDSLQFVFSAKKAIRAPHVSILSVCFPPLWSSSDQEHPWKLILLFSSNFSFFSQNASHIFKVLAPLLNIAGICQCDVFMFARDI